MSCNMVNNSSEKASSNEFHFIFVHFVSITMSSWLFEISPMLGFIVLNRFLLQYQAIKVFSAEQYINVRPAVFLAEMSLSSTSGVYLCFKCIHVSQLYLIFEHYYVL